MVSEKKDNSKNLVAKSESLEMDDEKSKLQKKATSDASPKEESKGSVTIDNGESSKARDVAMKTSAKTSRKTGRQASSGIAHIKATFNNTSVSITDMMGGVIAWSNGGRAGFKGSRKSTAFAATLVGQDAARQSISRGMHEVEVRVQGAGAGRESAVRALQSSGLTITIIKDVTPIPHNGCRPPKRRRV